MLGSRVARWPSGMGHQAKDLCTLDGEGSSCRTGVLPACCECRDTGSVSWSRFEAALAARECFDPLKTSQSKSLPKKNHCQHALFLCSSMPGQREWPLPTAKGVVRHSTSPRWKRHSRAQLTVHYQQKDITIQCWGWSRTLNRTHNKTIWTWIGILWKWIQRKELLFKHFFCCFLWHECKVKELTTMNIFRYVHFCAMWNYEILPGIFIKQWDWNYLDLAHLETLKSAIPLLLRFYL